jgi:hypothetical protein
MALTWPLAGISHCWDEPFPVIKLRFAGISWDWHFQSAGNKFRCNCNKFRCNCNKFRCNCNKFRCNCKNPSVNCKKRLVTAFLIVVHRGEGGDAASPRGGDTVCNITSKTKKMNRRFIDQNRPQNHDEKHVLFSSCRRGSKIVFKLTPALLKCPHAPLLTKN